MDRKEFFTQAFHTLLEKGVQVLDKTGAVKILETASCPPAVLKQRPPGASSDDAEFLRLCTGCDACMQACPVNIILIEDLVKRDPVIYPKEGHCIQCPGYPCISSCPTGALNRENGFKLRVIH